MSSEAQTEPKGEPSFDVDLGTAQSGGAVDDRLATTRLPPLVPPPRPNRIGSTPPPPGAQPSVVVQGATAVSFSPAPSEQPPRPAMSSSVQPRASFWRSLAAAPAVPPPDAAAVDRVIQRRLGSTCAGFSGVLLLIALAVGLQGAPPLSPRAPIVDASIVLSRGLVGLGLLVFGAAFLLVAVRLYVSSVRERDES